MELFIDGKLNPQAFEKEVLQATHELNDLLGAAAQTQSARVESTHLLMVLAQVPRGLTLKHLARFGIPRQDWVAGLASCAQQHPNALPPVDLTEATLDGSLRESLVAAQNLASSGPVPGPCLTEAALLIGALRHLTEPVARLMCDPLLGIKPEDWCGELEATLQPVIELTPLADQAPHPVRLASFSAGGAQVLTLLKSEAESLGFDKADPRHLLLALLVYEGGATQYGLFQQGLVPRRIHAVVMLSLRGQARRTPSRIPLDHDHLQPLLQRILEAAGRIAGRDRVGQIAEPHLLRGFLQVETSARRILEEEKVNLLGLQDVAESFDLSQEKPAQEGLATIETIRRRLEDRLVGQGQAVDRILQCVERLLFGFNTPGRPVGTFLFCGQSGSGKTEMAKQLAWAIFGSEDKLIFLEMGQFNTRESINIFVGAPPGYVGYGEGKLTNGLRDKPRAVVLFDEVEKADTKVLDALLRFLDEGKIDDPAGPVRDGSQCLIILTSNVGSEQLSRLWGEGSSHPDWPERVRQRLREELRKRRFRLEFLNRVDELILFRTLDKADYVEIGRRLLKRDLERLRREKEAEVEVDPAVLEAIGAYCERLGEGARATQRLTQSAVITPVISHLLRQKPALPVRLIVTLRHPTPGGLGLPVGEVAALP